MNKKLSRKKSKKKLDASSKSSSKSSKINLLYTDINKGDFIYKRFKKNKVIDIFEMDNLQWFALDSNYGEESYGPIVHTYIFKENPRLINIGNMKNRKFIEKQIVKHSPEFKKICNPDYQYSGGTQNYKYHSYLKHYFENDFDGTIIKNNEVDDEDLEGPTEIVLWKNFVQLIEEQ